MCIDLNRILKYFNSSLKQVSCRVISQCQLQAWRVYCSIGLTGLVWMEITLKLSIVNLIRRMWSPSFSRNQFCSGFLDAAKLENILRMRLRCCLLYPAWTLQHPAASLCIEPTDQRRQSAHTQTHTRLYIHRVNSAEGEQCKAFYLMHCMRHD